VPLGEELEETSLKLLKLTRRVLCVDQQALYYDALLTKID
jgi:hypothetical protein